MFVMIQSTDNPWLFVLVVGIQILIPMLQNGLDTELSSVFAIFTLAFLFLFIYFCSRILRFIKALYAMRNQASMLGWRELCMRAYRESRAMRNYNAQSAQPINRSNRFDKVMRTVQGMPLEEYKTPGELAVLKIADLKSRLKLRDVDVEGCKEKRELVDRLVSFRGGPINHSSCSICCEDYQTGDILRLLMKCKHEFHLECLDRWVYTLLHTERAPSCPLCNQVLE